MIKKIIFSTLFLLSFCLNLKASSLEDFNIPEKFNVTQRWFSLTSTFDLTTSEKISFGKVYRTFFSLRTEYNFYDCAEQIKATARLRWLSLYPVFDIMDHCNNPIGRVECYVLTLLPKYDILSPEGHLQALAKLNFWGTKFTISDPVTKEEIAIATRPFFAFKDNWSVTITNPELFKHKLIDPRLFITMLAFQTDKEFWESQSSSVSTNASIDFNYDIEALNSHFKVNTHCSTVAPQEEDFVFASSLLDPIVQMELDTTNNEFDILTNVIQKSLPLMENEAFTSEQKTAIYLLLKMKVKSFENAL